MPAKPAALSAAALAEISESLALDPAWTQALQARFNEGDFPAAPVAAAAAAARRQAAAVKDLVHGDPNELLSASRASRTLGYKNPNQVTTYLREHPGYFPEPDEAEVIGTTENPRRRLGWRRVTLLCWVLTRPGKGRRHGSSREAGALPEVLEAGDPQELLGASQAAALLGFKSINTFSSSLAQGRLPLLKEVDSLQPAPRGGPAQRKWTRRRILQQAQARRQPARGNLPAVSADGDPDELLGVPEAAALLGYKSANSFTNALGRLPLLAEPDDLQPSPRGGPPRRRWTRRRILEQARARKAR